MQASARRTFLVELGLVAFLHLLLALVATYPLLRVFDRMPVGGGDTVQNVWNLWWVQKAVLNGQLWPFHTAMLFAPDGASLAYHPLGVLNGWLGAVLHLSVGLNLAATYNAITLLAFVLSGVTCYLLARTIGGRPAAALAASIIFTFAPVRMSRVFFGNLEMYSTGFIPLAAFFAVRLQATHRWSYGVLLAVTLALVVWTSLYLAYGTAIMVGLLMLFYSLEDRRRSRATPRRPLLPVLMVAGGVALLLSAPVIWPMVRDYQDFRSQADQVFASTHNSADVLGYVVPDDMTSPLLSRLLPVADGWIERTYATFFGNAAEKTVFLGYTVLLVTAAAILVAPASCWRPWLFTALAFLVLALGPVLHLGGQALFAPLPYSWLSAIPLVSFGRAPSRLVIFAMLALAIIVGCGLAALEQKRQRLWIVSLVVALIVFLEFLIAPLRVDERFLNVPPYLRLMREATSPGSVMDIPIDRIGAEGPAGDYMLYQTVHEKPIVSGYISRTPDKVRSLFERPFFNALRARIYGDTEPYELTPELIAQARQELAALGVGHVVLHRDQLAPRDFEIIRAALNAALDTPTFEDARTTFWDVD